MSIETFINKYTPEEQLLSPKLLAWVGNHAKPPEPIAIRCRPKLGQLAVFVGTSHNFAKDDNLPELDIVQANWDIFIEETGGQNCVVLYEGRYPKKYRITDEQTARKNGDKATLIYWAEQLGIPAESPEPQVSHEAAMLLEQFPKEQVMTYYITRQAPQLAGLDPAPDINDYVRQTFYDYRIYMGWADRLFNMNDFTGWYKHYLGRDFGFTSEDRKFQIEQTANYMIPQSPIQEVSWYCNYVIRDDAHAKAIKRHITSGKHIFDLFGWHHIYTLLPTIEGLGEYAERICEPPMPGRNLKALVWELIRQYNTITPTPDLIGKLSLKAATERAEREVLKVRQLSLQP